MRGCSGGHAWLLGGACVVAPGGCVVALGGACMVARGAYMVAPGGREHVWDTTRYGDTVNERAVRILLECILVNNILSGILDNSFSLIVFLSSRDLRGKLTNWYLINQSVLDLFASIVLLLVTVTVTLSDAFVGLGIAAELHCR